MLRLRFFGPFVIGCTAVAFAGLFASSAHSQYGGVEDEEQAQTGFDPGYGEEMAAGIEEQRFQRGIRRVVKSLEQAETEEEKKRLLDLGRKGLEWRYQSKLDVRERELEKLRQRLKELEDDYARRTQAMPRVVNLQLESLKLAAEGLINLEDVVGSLSASGMGRSPRRSYGGGGYGAEMDGYGGEMSGMGGYGEMGGEAVPPVSQPIKPDEDPFEGLGADDKNPTEPDEPGELGEASTSSDSHTVPRLPGSTPATPPSAPRTPGAPLPPGRR